MFVALARYRAGQLAFLRRHASRTFSAHDLETASPDRVIGDGQIFDPQLRWAGMIVSATSARGEGLHGVVDLRWISTLSFASCVERDRGGSYIAQRLCRWL